MSTGMTKSTYAQDYFFINRKLLLYGGLTTLENPSALVYRLHKIYQLVVCISTIFVCPISIFIGAAENRDQIAKTIKCINAGLTILLGSIKSVFWLLKSKNIEDIMNTIESGEFDYEKVQDFDPGLLTREAKVTGFRYGLFFFIIGEMSLLMLYIPAYFSSLRYIINNGLVTNATFFKDSPYYTYIPFQHVTPLTYIIALTYEFVPINMIAINIIGIDTLFMNILNFIGVHLVILRGAFRSIRARSLKKIKGPPMTEDGLNNSNELEEQMLREMKKSIKHLQKIIWVCEELEANYTYITLGQVLCSLFIICSSLFLVTTTPVVSTGFANELFYLMSGAYQLLLYCWFGNEVTLKASGIPEAIWESDWYETRQPYRTCMLLTMLRMQRPFCVTIGKFTPLSLNAYISILKGSYSYFTVLSNRNA